MTRTAELAAARAAANLSEEDCLIWLGVGLATIERVEAGEVEPGEELEGRIERFLQNRCGGPLAAALPDRRLSHSGGPSGGGAAVTGAAASFAQPNRRAL